MFDYYSKELVLGGVIAFVQGVVAVPEYRLVYVCAHYLAQKFFPDRKRDLRPISTWNFSLEGITLALTSGLLLIPYLLYFEFIEAPEGVNSLWLWCFAIGFVVFRIAQELFASHVRRRQPIYVDLDNFDQKGRYFLTSFWTLRDLEKYQIELEQGKTINTYAYVKGEKQKRERKLSGAGKVYFDGKEKKWVASVEWKEEPASKNNTSTRD